MTKEKLKPRRYHQFENMDLCPFFRYIHCMGLSREFLENAGAIVVALAEIFQPFVKPDTLILPYVNDVAMVSVQATPPVHENRAAKLSGLFRENLLESARTNARCDTFQSQALNGQTPVSGPPRRRECHTDKFVFSWDAPSV
jgi:hypothetical protein